MANSNELFFATGIDNSKMRKDANDALAILQKLSTDAGKLKIEPSKGSPLAKTSEGIKKDGKEITDQLGFIEKQFKYAATRLLAYGSINIAGQFAHQIITIKGEFDQFRVAIDAFVGSAEKGQKVFDELSNLAVKSPFQLTEITDSAKQMLAYGEAADTVTNTVSRLSDVAAGSKQPLSQIAYLYGTSLTQGRLYARDLFQFANRGIPIYKELAKTMGVSTEELMKMVSAGKVGFPQLQKAIDGMTSAGGRYYGLSDKLAETTYGKISNLKDKLDLMFYEIGNASDGMVQTALSGATVIIENWKGIVTVIEDAIVAYGAYKVATAVAVSLNSTVNAAAYRAEAIALESLVAVETKEALIKQGMTFGSAEYLAAVKGEIAANLEKASLSVASSEVEITAKRALLLEEQALVSACMANVAAQEARLASVVKTGVAIDIEAASVGLNNAQTELNTAISARNATGKELKALKTNLASAATTKASISEGLDTAAQIANGTATNYLTWAKNALTTAMIRLNATLAANPYLAAALAVAALIAGIYALTNQATAAEKANESFKNSIDSLNKSADEEKRKFDDLLNVIKSNVSAQGDRIAAYNKMKLLYPDILKGMTLEQVRLTESTKLQKQHNDEVFRGYTVQLIMLKAQSDARLAQEKRNKEANNLVKKGGFGDATDASVNSISTQRTNERYDEELKLNQLLEKQIKDRMTVAIAGSKSEAASYTTAAKQLREYRNEIAKLKKEIGDIRGNKAIKDPAGEIEARIKSIKEYESKIEALTGSKKGRTRVPKQSDTSYADRERKIKEATEKLKLINKKAEDDLSQSSVDALEDGFEKKLAQIELNYKKEQIKIQEEEGKILKIAQDREKNIWLNDPQRKKNAKNKVKDVFNPKITSISDVSAQDKKAVLALNEANDKNLLDQKADLYTNLLKELNDYSLKVVEIDKKTADQVAFIEKSRKDKGDKATDEAIARAKKIGAEQIASLDFDELKKDVDWETVFGDLEKISTTTINSVQGKLKAMLSKKGDMSSSEIKSIVDALDKLNNVKLKRDPLDVFIKSVKALSKANKDIDSSKKKLSGLKKGTDEYAAESERLVEAENRKKAATFDMGTSFSVVAEKTKIFAGELGNLGSILGDDTEIALNLVSTIITSVVAGMSGIVNLMTVSSSAMVGVSASAAASIRAIETASVILAIISAAIQLAMAVVNLLTGENESKKKYEEMKSAAEAYASTVDHIIASQKKMIEGLSGESAVKEYKKIQDELKSLIEVQRDVAIAAAGKRSAWAHSTGYRINEALEQYFGDYKVNKYGNGGWGSITSSGISASAGQKITRIEDFYSLTPQQLEKIRKENASAWAAISEDVREPFDKMIELNQKLEDSILESMDKLTGLSFDAARDSLDDLLMSADTTAKDVADNFEEYMKKAMLNIAKSKFLSEDLSNWYKDFAEKAKGGLTKDEVDSLRDKYLSIFKKGQEQMDELSKITGIDLDKGNSKNSSSNGFKSMTQDTADLLSAQFTAIRLNVSDILRSITTQSGILEIAAKDISEIKVNTRELALIKSVLTDMKNNGIKMK